MIVGGYGDGGETFRANKDVGGVREAMRGSTESAEGGEGVAVELFEALQECSRV